MRHKYLNKINHHHFTEFNHKQLNYHQNHLRKKSNTMRQAFTKDFNEHIKSLQSINYPHVYKVFIVTEILPPHHL